MSKLAELGESVTQSVLDRVGKGFSEVQERTPLAYDLLEGKDAYLVVFDASGATQDDIQVRYLGGEIEVRIDRFRDLHQGYDMRFPGRGLALNGSLRLPDDAIVTPETAEATLTKNGTLEVRLPKDPAHTDVDVRDESTS
ncbi:MAG: molecular chaperone, small heat shock protein [Haloquadratum sp. J07HQX50]|jgi:Molecular chaperone (small heat shock protein)|nr:MAG: molecular chaperone, small heat shock protein [Haloquadratum sp. J07HQX50]